MILYTPYVGLVGHLVDAFVAWLIVGLIAGWLAGLVTRGRGYGCCGDIVLGWIGAIVGGFIIDGLFGLRAGTGLLGSIFVAFVGAFIVLLLARLLFGNNRN